MDEKVMVDGVKRVVSKLLARRKLKRSYEYEVQWEGQPSSSDYTAWLSRDRLVLILCNGLTECVLLYHVALSDYTAWLSRDRSVLILCNILCWCATWPVVHKFVCLADTNIVWLAKDSNQCWCATWPGVCVSLLALLIARFPIPRNFGVCLADANVVWHVKPSSQQGKHACNVSCPSLMLCLSVHAVLSCKSFTCACNMCSLLRISLYSLEQLPVGISPYIPMC